MEQRVCGGVGCFLHVDSIVGSGGSSLEFRVLLLLSTAEMGRARGKCPSQNVLRQPATNRLVALHPVVGKQSPFQLPAACGQASHLGQAAGQIKALYVSIVAAMQ